VNSSPARSEVSSLKSISSTSSDLPRLDKELSVEEKSSCQTPVKTAETTSVSGTPRSRDATEDRRPPKLVMSQDSSTGSQFQTLLDTPTKPVAPGRPQHLKIRLNPTEQTIVAKRYAGSDEAVGDINRLMTSSCHVITPSADVISASGSKTSSTSSLDSGCDELDGVEPEVTSRPAPRPLIEASFRRAELVPTVRRFIKTCQVLALASTVADQAADFDGLLTDSVHAFVAVLAVSRRATYGQKECDSLSEALKQVAEAYCVMVAAAGYAVGMAEDHPATIEASKKAACLAERLSSLLLTVKQLKANRAANSRIVFF